MVSTGLGELDRLIGGGDGYPDRSGVLVVGPPGIGKEALGYWFTQSGLVQGDFCLYLTRLSVREVTSDMKAFLSEGALERRVPMWIASEGGELKFDINDLAGLSFNLKEILKKNDGRRIRITTDVLSSLLMLNPTDAIYKFLSQLLAETKRYDCVFLSTIEEGMHSPQALAAMEQLFDGVIELKLYEEGLKVLPLLRIKKMRGITPQPGYYRFSFAEGTMEISSYVK